AGNRRLYRCSTTVGVAENLGSRAREVKGRRLTVCLGRDVYALTSSARSCQSARALRDSAGPPGFPSRERFCRSRLETSSPEPTGESRRAAVSPAAWP